MNRVLGCPRMSSDVLGTKYIQISVSTKLGSYYILATQLFCAEHAIIKPSSCKCLASIPQENVLETICTFAARCHRNPDLKHNHFNAVLPCAVQATGRRPLSPIPSFVDKNRSRSRTWSECWEESLLNIQKWNRYWIVSQNYPAQSFQRVQKPSLLRAFWWRATTTAVSSTAGRSPYLWLVTPQSTTCQTCHQHKLQSLRRLP